MLGKVKRLLPHAAVLICNMYIVFYLIDRVNKAMNFIDNDLTKGLLLILCVVGLLNFRQTREFERAARRPARRSRPVDREYGARRSYGYESGYDARRSSVRSSASGYRSSGEYRSGGASGRSSGARSGYASSGARTRRY